MQALMPLAPEHGIAAAAPAGGHRGLPDGPAAKPATWTSPACNAIATWWRRGGRGGRADFWPDQPQTTLYAHTLGQALQLTNIIRDVGEDAMRGRIYLPVSDLQQFGVKAQEILKRTYSDRFTALMQFQAQRAHALYDQALALLPAVDRRAQKPGLMMASIYRALLREIEGAISGAAPTHQPDAAAQVLAGLEGAGAGTDVTAWDKP
jgi:hypothetical protein